MKSKLFFASLLCLLAVAFVSCNKEEMDVEPQLEQSDDLQAKAALLPDLVIPSFGSDISSTTTLCGPVLPNISCMGGDRQFFAIIIIANNGPGDLPPGSFKVLWYDVTNSHRFFPDQLVNHNGIRAGQSIRVQRPIWVGPCDCVPPFTPFTHTYQAFVDIDNQVAENNETNNRSPLFDACDGC